MNILRRLNIFGISFALFILLTSCWGKNRAQSVNSVQDSIASASFTIAGMDSIVMNDSIFFQYRGSLPPDPSPDNQEVYANQIFLGTDQGSDDKYQTRLFIPKENSDRSVYCCVLDSIPLWDGKYALLFSYIIYDMHNADDYHSDTQGWLAIYSPGNKYIDSRLIYRKLETDDVTRSTNSKLYLPQKKITILNNDNFEDAFWEIPVTINNDGVFQEYPEIPYSKTEIAIGSCNGDGLSGKFPLKQSWTVINFNDNAVGEAKTDHVAQDLMGNISTKFSNLGKDLVGFDIAFKGTYSKKDIQLLSPKQESDEQMKLYIEQNFPAEALSIQNIKIDNINLFSFWQEENRYYAAIVKCKYTENDYNGEYDVLVGVTPMRQVVLLASRCIYDFKIFKVKESAMLHVVSTSCGEGAYGQTLLYKVNDGFKKIFEDDITCD